MIIRYKLTTNLRARIQIETDAKAIVTVIVVMRCKYRFTCHCIIQGLNNVLPFISTLASPGAYLHINSLTHTLKP